VVVVMVEGEEKEMVVVVMVEGEEDEVVPEEGEEKASTT
jgi:6-phosphogluconolactonase/glucosamine-6-phosphate isomerase/deaminase